MFNHKIAAIKHVRETYFVKHTIPSPTYGGNTVVYYETPTLKDSKDLVEDIMKIDSNTEYTEQVILNLRNELAAERLKLSKVLTQLEDVLNITKRIGW